MPSVASKTSSGTKAAVVAVGDLGRSPRILLHARALAAEGVEVDLVGCPGAALPRAISEHQRIAVHWLEAEITSSPRGSFGWSLLRAIRRGVRLLVRLCVLLVWGLERPHVILVQNPPGVPSLIVAWLAARIRGARLVIDWHNLTYSMLALRLGPRHALVRAVTTYECVLGRTANVNLFVSAAMSAELARRFGVRGIVFRDHPAEQFEPLDAAVRSRVRERVFAQVGLSEWAGDAALVISATSWTADEDFSLLLDALRQYDARSASRESNGVLPRLVVVITGTGPLKASYEERFRASSLSRVAIHTAWFDGEEYSKSLAAADLGVCMHTSSSGLDLPMKIADMFGSHVPVVAFDYGSCLRELVEPGVNGLLFTSSTELAEHLETVLRGFPQEVPALVRLRDGAARSARLRWNAAWRREARGPLLDG